MEPLSFDFDGSRMHVKGYPDGIKIVELKNPVAKQLAHIALHRSDLERAREYLRQINMANNEIVRHGIWDAAVVRFVKCFKLANGRTTVLKFKNIYGADEGSRQSFDFFIKLRDKHIVHDDNAYSQANIGAIINDGSKEFKVERIVAFSQNFTHLDQATYSNLTQLIDKALEWINTEFDKFCELITEDLENKPIGVLLSMPAVVTKVPSVEELGRTRAGY